MASSRGYGTISSAGTFVLNTKDTILEKVFAIGTNTTVLAFFDAATAANATFANRRYQLTMNSADITLGLPMNTGITVVASSPVGTTVIAWSHP